MLKKVIPYVLAVIVFFAALVMLHPAAFQNGRCGSP